MSREAASANSNEQLTNDERLARVFQALEDLTGLMGRQVQMNQAPNPVRELTIAEQKIKCLAEFRRLKPPNFRGNKGQVVCEAEKWLKEIKKLFEVTSMPEEFKEAIASSLLFDEADHWWDTVKIRHDFESMTWTTFEELFYAQYFRDVVREAKLQEFLHLTQRNMTVAEYDAKFMELSRFRKCLIAMEEMKASKFERGLRPTIREKLVALRIRQYSDMVDSAMSVDREREDFQKIQERSRGSHKNQHRCPSNNKRQKGGQDSSGGSFEGNFNKALDEYFYCGKNGHFKRNYPSLLSAPRNDQAQS
ncbi:uncharacterized protein LOC132304755 [Cornus florida]|uniref:uncharacterized protein LOC132304755 n=1 Tax=Cornus florida TaxID=4283 RepID=UPI0028970394|nr:uncharacterized protein LOC132304755 [Cornus florida]